MGSLPLRSLATGGTVQGVAREGVGGGSTSSLPFPRRRRERSRHSPVATPGRSTYRVLGRARARRSGSGTDKKPIPWIQYLAPGLLISGPPGVTPLEGLSPPPPAQDRDEGRVSDQEAHGGLVERSAATARASSRAAGGAAGPARPPAALEARGGEAQSRRERTGPVGAAAARAPPPGGDHGREPAARKPGARRPAQGPLGRRENPHGLRAGEANPDRRPLTP